MLYHYYLIINWVEKIYLIINFNYTYEHMIIFKVLTDYKAHHWQ